MSVSATIEEKGKKPKTVQVTVNRKYKVAVPDREVTGLEIKEASIAQHVPIEIDFIVTLEARDGQPARTINDGDTVKINKHSEFTINDGDDDS